MADQEGFRRGLADMANARVENGFTGAGDELRQIIESHDVVFAVWQDASQPDGVGITLIRGDALLDTSVDTHHPLSTNLTAIPCAEFEEAEAMRKVYGQSKHQH